MGEKKTVDTPSVIGKEDKSQLLRAIDRLKAGVGSKDTEEDKPTTEQTTDQGKADKPFDLDTSLARWKGSHPKAEERARLLSSIRTGIPTSHQEYHAEADQVESENEIGEGNSDNVRDFVCNFMEREEVEEIMARKNWGWRLRTGDERGSYDLTLYSKTNRKAGVIKEFTLRIKFLKSDMKNVVDYLLGSYE